MGSSPGNEFSVDYTVSRKDSRVSLDRIERLLAFAAEKERIRGQLGLWLCTDEEIADLHLRFMDIPGETDVITFPEDAPDSGGYLGDIAVSVDTAESQARDAGHAPEREIAYLCLHGLLHIAGYDDLEEHDKRRMFERQEKLLSEFEQRDTGEWAEQASSQPGNDDPERS